MDLDSRYDKFQLGNYIPSVRCSVKHIRELEPNIGMPRSFISRNGILPPHLFRDANESHGPVSPFPMFKLPEECVGKIMFYLGGSDLAALALVDRDCRQLARTRQFRSVWINFSTASMALLNTLLEEALVRARNSVGPYRWKLGACIRRMSIAVDLPIKIAQVPRLALKRENEWAAEYHFIHIHVLEYVLQHAVPNLDFLDWKDRMSIVQSLPIAMVNSPITTLELHGVSLAYEFEIGVPTQRPTWRLRKLMLGLNSPGFFTASISTLKFTRSILEFAAPTLEELVWDGSMEGTHLGRSHSFGSDPIGFPKLRELHMIRIQMDDTVLPSLIPAENEKVGLTHLWLQSQAKNLAPFLAKRGHIPTLKHLNWMDIPSHNIDQCVSFIAENPQLQAFQFEDPSASLLEMHLIPLFTSMFDSLTSLALVWETTHIPAASLGRIGKLFTLKYLWLSAGNQCGEDLTWIVDHRVLKKQLRGLRQLERFALTRDWYPHGNNYIWGQHPLNAPTWEAKHHEIMAQHAVTFAKTHPKLEWVHFGQIPMSIKQGLLGRDPIATALVAQRGRHGRLLEEMWGEYHPNWVY